MRVLFLTPGAPDYLADAVLHGLRQLIGSDVVDVPKAQHLYAGADRGNSYGRGFTFGETLADLDIERGTFDEEIDRDWDLVVVGEIWRLSGKQLRRLRRQPTHKLVVLDGHDVAHIFPHSLRLMRSHGWGMPRLDRDALYYKRELMSESSWLRWYRIPPRRWFTSPPPGIRPIAFAIPEEKIISETPRKTKDFPVHVVDAEIAEAVGATTSYAFTSEADYYADLQATRWGITTKRRGWDCLRHYEIAANGAVPCFRDLDRLEASCAPHGLEPGHNAISYTGAEDLFRKIGEVDPEEYATLQANSLAWVRANSTVARARSLLADAGFLAAT